MPPAFTFGTNRPGRVFERGRADNLQEPYGFETVVPQSPVTIDESVVESPERALKVALFVSTVIAASSHMRAKRLARFLP